MKPSSHRFPYGVGNQQPLGSSKLGIGIADVFAWKSCSQIADATGGVKRFSLARAVKREAYAAYLAARDPRVPWDAKALACRSLAMMCASHFEGGPSHEPE